MTDAEYEVEWQKNNPENTATSDHEMEALFHYPP
ncbi:hypothetical protein A2U01_0093317, partial [Trifolium medium]|nr:hypothetical protein [Trifolium medium]